MGQKDPLHEGSKLLSNDPSSRILTSGEGDKFKGELNAWSGDSCKREEVAGYWS